MNSRLLEGGANHLLLQVVEAGFLPGNDDTVCVEKERLPIKRPLGGIFRQNLFAAAEWR